MSKKKLSIQFYYDIVSPYSYIAFHVLKRYQPHWNFNLELCPISLGGIMKMAGNQPPLVLKPRMKYMMIDLARTSKFTNLPLTFPENFPLNTLKSMRLLHAVKKTDPVHLSPLTSTLYHHFWAQKGVDLSDESTLRDTCLSLDGVDQTMVDKWLTDYESAQNKQSLIEETNKIVDKGAYGAPTMLVSIDSDSKPQFFFGSDRFEQMAHVLNLPWYGPCPPTSPGKNSHL